LANRDLPLRRNKLIEVASFSKHDVRKWDEFVINSTVPNLLFMRNYINYHEDKFIDRSLMCFQSNELVAVFPAAESPVNANEVISHPGLSFGGLISKRSGSQDTVEACLDAISKYFSESGYKTFTYKAVPHIYHTRPFEQDEYFLWKQGFVCNRIDLSVSINLSRRIEFGSRRLRGIKKAGSTLSLSRNMFFIESFWRILENNLKNRHSATPTHSLEEIRLLNSRFPKDIIPIFAVKDEKCVGGVIIYRSPQVHHAQYIAASNEGQNLGALDFIFDEAVKSAREDGAAFFDFGISTTNNGRDLNEGLYSFKYQFGGGGTCQRFYSKEL
jgi:hypothetical protein